MTKNALPHVLVACGDPHYEAMLSEILELEGYPLTVVETPDEAFAVARASLHPLMIIADSTMIFFGKGFLALFTEHADALPPLEWVTIGLIEYPRNGGQAFFARREAEHLPFRFRVVQFLTAIERAALRLKRRAQEVARGA
jgi:CheY-like chemotaxis protein